MQSHPVGCRQIVIQAARQRFVGTILGPKRRPELRRRIRGGVKGISVIRPPSAAFGTLSSLNPGHMVLAIGTGEALNEVAVGAAGSP